MNDLFKHAKSIADELEKVVNGEYFRDAEDEEPISIFDYFTDCFDLQWTVTRGSDGKLEVVGGRVMVGCGGPNIYITDSEVEIYWWGDRATYSLSGEVRDAMLEFFKETFNIHLLVEAMR